MKIQLNILSDYYEDGGLIYPLEDTRARKVHHKTLRDMDSTIRLCKKKRVAIQAGGNCGIWARKMCQIFDSVYTWEPDPINFVALAVNTARCRNLIKFQAALGNESKYVGMSHQMYGKIPNTLNCGATYVEGSGIIPTMKIDDLNLPYCDLIYLDIEGYELFALEGSKETIAKHRPVIACEDKELSERYNVKQGDLVNYLTNMFNYSLAGTVRKDVIMVPPK